MLKIKSSTPLIRKTRDMFIVVLVLVCAAGVVLTACDNTEIINNSYKTLKIAAETYDGSMKTAADLYERGLLDEAGKEKVVEIGHKYKAAHLVAVNALESYSKTTDADDQEKLQVALAEVTRLVFELRELVPELKL